MSNPAVYILSDADREAIVLAYFQFFELDLPPLDQPAEPHERAYWSRQAEGFSMLQKMDESMTLIGEMSSFVPDFSGSGLTPNYVPNPAIDQEWNELEAFAILAARTHALSIVRAQAQQGSLRQLLETGHRRATIWANLSEAQKQALFQEHSEATGTNVSYQLAA